MRNFKFRYFDRLTGKIEDFDGMPMLIEELEDINEREGMVVMQSTGLKDENGVEIFEGDIVRIETYKNREFRSHVRFEKGCFHIGYIPDAMCEHHIMKVIGNIHQNKSLLEEYDDKIEGLTD